MAVFTTLLLTSCRDRTSWPGIPFEPYWVDAPSEYSLGILTGPTPFDLTGSANHIDNPVLTAADVPDIATAFLADPFLFNQNNRWYMFYELLRASPRRGIIGWAESNDGFNWQHMGVSIEEPFHLSYPLVFEFDGIIYMLLESNEAGHVRLYEAATFPSEWKLASKLFDGRYTDPTIIRHDDRWWIFASDLANLNLYLFHSENLLDGWREHPLSPVVRGDILRARPGGRMMHYDGRLWRFAQNCFPRYGTDIRHYEITRLTTTEYEERDGGSTPLIQAGMFPWAKLGMHHVDHQPFESGDDRWLVAVDGNTPAQPEVPLEIRFADGSMLLGATCRPKFIAPGETMLLRFYWKNLAPGRRPAAFVHFRNSDGIVFQADHQLDGRRDWYDLFVTIPEHVTEGALEIHLGLHQDGKRIAARSPYPQTRNAVALPLSVNIKYP